MQVPATNFGVYGSFWISVSIYTYSDPSAHDLENTLCFLRIIVAVYSLYTLVASMFANKTAFVLFLSLEVELILYIVGFLNNQPNLMKIGGW